MRRSVLSEAALRDQVVAMGRELTPELLKGSQQLYASEHESPPYEGVILQTDLSYGPDPRQRLDVFRPVDDADGRPVLVYVHGGGFVRGDKKVEGLPYFHNIGVWAARHGCLGIAMTYRLAPHHPAPAAHHDVAMAMQWVRDHAVEHGGDPRRIVLMGHSAGAILVADHVARMGSDTDGVVGAILGSGNYDFARLENATNVRNYYGADYAAHSPLPGLRRSRVPLMVSVGEIETHDFQEQALLLVDMLFARDGVLPRFVRQSGQNHYTCCYRIGSRPNDPIERELDEFIRLDCAPHRA